MFCFIMKKSSSLSIPNMQLNVSKKSHYKTDLAFSFSFEANKTPQKAVKTAIFRYLDYYFQYEFLVKNEVWGLSFINRLALVTFNEFHIAFSTKLHLEWHLYLMV